MSTRARRFGDALYRALLVAFPADVRAEDADEMVAHFSAERAAQRGHPVRLARLWLQGAADLVWHGLLDRLGVPPRLSPPSRKPSKGRPTMWGTDIRHAWRRLRSSPATALTAAAMLALAVGLTAAMFTIIDALVLRPVPFPHADRLARMVMFTPTGGRYAISLANYAAWRELSAFDAVEAFDTGTSLVETDAGLVARESAFVSTGLFDLLGAQPLRGRLFAPSEGRAGGDDAAVIISEGLWRRYFGADPTIVGRRVVVDDAALTVVGVLPDTFRFPAWRTAIWRPVDVVSPPAGLAGKLPQAITRRAEGVPETDALRLATAAAHEADPQTAEWKMTATALALAGPRSNDYIVQAAPLLAGGVALVFMILCANVSSLLLARVTVRSRELGIATALGASRARLLREVFVETGIIGMAGIGTGVVFAAGLIQVARAFLPEAVLQQTLNPVNMDLPAVAVASMAGLMATLATGVLPAWIGSRASAGGLLRGADRGGTETRAARSASRVLLVGEIALACTLLVGATLLVRSFVNLATADRGLEPSGLLAVWVNGLPSPASDRVSRLSDTQAIEDAVRAIPGIRQVAFSFGAPPDGGGFSAGDSWLSDAPGATEQSLWVNRYWVTAEFFELYGIPILRGRTFRSDDADDAVIAGERFAALMWPGLDPVGRTFRYNDASFRVIGIAREIHLPAVDPRLDRPELYQPFARGRGNFTLSLQCGVACPDAAVIRKGIQDARPGTSVWRVDVVEHAYAEQTARPRAAAALALAFATIAVLAAAGGLFSVLSYAVGRRRREFGIRLALGARPAEVRRLIVADGLRVALAGLVIGGAAAWGLAETLASMTYGVAAGELSIWITVAAAVMLTTLLASWRPAVRAGRVNPVVLLREE